MRKSESHCWQLCQITINVSASHPDRVWREEGRERGEGGEGRERGGGRGRGGGNIYGPGSALEYIPAIPRYGGGDSTPSPEREGILASHPWPSPVNRAQLHSL